MKGDGSLFVSKGSKGSGLIIDGGRRERASSPGVSDQTCPFGKSPRHGFFRARGGSAIRCSNGSWGETRRRRQEFRLLYILTHRAQEGKIALNPPAVQTCLTRWWPVTSLFLNLVVKIAPTLPAAAREGSSQATRKTRGGDSITTKDTNYTKGDRRSGSLFELRIRPSPNSSFRVFSVFRGPFPMVLAYDDSSPRWHRLKSASTPESIRVLREIRGCFRRQSSL